jgi:hypothetical protein
MKVGLHGCELEHATIKKQNQTRINQTIQCGNLRICCNNLSAVYGSVDFFALEKIEIIQTAFR